MTLVIVLGYRDVSHLKITEWYHKKGIKYAGRASMLLAPLLKNNSGNELNLLTVWSFSGGLSHLLVLLKHRERGEEVLRVRA